MSIEFFRPEDAEFEFTYGAKGGFFDQISGAFLKNKIYEYSQKVISLDSANRLLHERGTLVYSHSEEEQRKLDYYAWKPYPNFLGASREALLINIHPFKPESEERALLREIIETIKIPSVAYSKIFERAKKLLGDA